MACQILVAIALTICSAASVPEIVIVFGGDVRFRRPDNNSHLGDQFSGANSIPQFTEEVANNLAEGILFHICQLGNLTIVNLQSILREKYLDQANNSV